MHNIEKLAIEHCIGKYKNSTDGERYYFRLVDLEAFAKALQQSSEPVAEIKKRDGDYNYIHWYTLLQQLAEGTLLFTHPPASVPPVQSSELVATISKMEIVEPVATVCMPDPEDERDGVRFSLKDWENLNALPAKTQLYTLPPSTVPLEKYNKLLDALKFYANEARYIENYRKSLDGGALARKATAEAEGKEG